MRLTRLIALPALLLAASVAGAQVREAGLTVDATAPTRPFPHFWERMFGSGRAVLTLRESYRQDLRTTTGRNSCGASCVTTPMSGGVSSERDSRAAG